MIIRPVANYGASILATAPRALAFLASPDQMALRANISAFKEDLLASPDRVELAFTETLANGLYTRTLFIPKNTYLVGKIHRKACVNIVAKGDISIMTETGAMRVQAGYTVTSPPGIQKVGYAHEDTFFVNVFRTDETDISKVEFDLIAENFDALECARG
jgi:hypothetical protein